MIKNLLWVGLGGGIGSMCRYLVSLPFAMSSFPLATLIVNIAGSFIIGCILGFSANSGNPDNGWRLFLATGLCGGFTTFSAFSAENLRLIQQGSYTLPLLYIAGSVAGGILAVGFGFKLLTN